MNFKCMNITFKIMISINLQHVQCLIKSNTAKLAKYKLTHKHPSTVTILLFHLISPKI